MSLVILVLFSLCDYSWALVEQIQVFQSELQTHDNFHGNPREANDKKHWSDSSRNAIGFVINHCLQGQDNSCLCTFAYSCERFKSMSNT